MVAIDTFAHPDATGVRRAELIRRYAPRARLATKSPGHSAGNGFAFAR